MLRRYGSGDLWLQLRLLGDADTMVHLGGPESTEQIEERHERFLRMTDPEDGGVFVIELVDGEAAGTISYWPRRWREADVWEIGWLVLPEHRRRGVAGAGLRDLLDLLTSSAVRRPVHAFPSVANGPSNALCRSAGLGLAGEVDLEYPKGHVMRCNDWVLDVRRGPAPPSRRGAAAPARASSPRPCAGTPGASPPA